MAIQACGGVLDAADPYGFYAMLRDRGPVVRAESGQWLVTRHAEASAVLRDPRFAHWRLPAERSSFDRLLNGWMSRLDPAGGSPLRHSLVSALAAPRHTEAARRAALLLGEDLQQRRSFDVIADFARPFTLLVAAEILGIPAERQEEFVSLVSETRPLFAATTAIGRDDGSAASRLARWLADHHQRAGTFAGAATTEEAVAFATFLLFAAHDNMMNFIGNAFVALLRDERALESLRRGPEITNAAVEELLRFDSPVQFVSVLAREPVDVGGSRIGEGEVVWVCVGSANRDERRFASPDALQLDREDNAHLSFGLGPTKCIGAHLARLEGRLALEILLQLRHPRLLEDVAWRTEASVLRGAVRIVIEHDGPAVRRAERA